jgi:tRNA1(Val) A37 N6-methylase TrmN6
VATDKKNLTKILKLTDNVKLGRVVDLGSGNGNVLIAFAKKSIELEGYEINPFLVLLSRIKIKRLGLDNKVRIFWHNFWDVNLSKYDTVFVYGVPYIMKDLEKKSQSELKKGAYILSFSYPFPDWKYFMKNDQLYLYKKS